MTLATVLVALFLLYSTMINLGFSTQNSPQPDVEGYKGGYDLLGLKNERGQWKWKWSPGRAIDQNLTYVWTTRGWHKPSDARRNAHQHTAKVKGIGNMKMSDALGDRKSDAAVQLEKQAQNSQTAAKRAKELASLGISQLEAVKLSNDKMEKELDALVNV